METIKRAIFRKYKVNKNDVSKFKLFVFPLFFCSLNLCQKQNETKQNHTFILVRTKNSFCLRLAFSSSAIARAIARLFTSATQKSNPFHVAIRSVFIHKWRIRRHIFFPPTPAHRVSQHSTNLSHTLTRTLTWCPNVPAYEENNKMRYINYRFSCSKWIQNIYINAVRSLLTWTWENLFLLSFFRPFYLLTEFHSDAICLRGAIASEFGLRGSIVARRNVGALNSERLDFFPPLIAHYYHN